MRAMAQAGRGRNHWMPVFVLALLLFGGSLVALALAVKHATEDTKTAAAADSAGGGDAGMQTAASPAAIAKLRYRGTLPGALAATGMEPEGADAQADIAFSADGGDGSVVVRYWVPVISMHAGIDTLTKEQLDGLIEGSLGPADVGGIGKTMTFAGVASESATVSGFASVPGKLFESTGALYAAMGDWASAPILAFVPLEDVKAGVTAIAVDGVDLVRGRGDASAWPYVERTRVAALTKKGEAAAPALRTDLAAKLPQVTHIMATGDILQSRCSLTRIEATGDWGAALRGPVGEYLAAADLALGSLDGSIQDVGTPYGCVAVTNLTSPPQVMEALTLAGFDEMTVATNHVFDCGQIGPCGDKAFLQTIDRLQAAGIKVVGGGHNLAEALAPATFEVNGVKFAVLGFDDIAAEDLEATADSPGTAPVDDSYADEKAALPHEPAFYKPADMLHLTQFEDAIRKAKADADVVIVQVQTGYEDTHDPSPRAIKALRAAVDAGADLVVGNQAHWVQAVEMRGDVFVAYALGNFIFDQQHTPEHEQGYLLEASFWGKKLANVRMLPYQIRDQYKPVFVSGTTRAKILGDVFSASKALASAP